MKVFFDTEFEGLYKNSNLISIGLISEDGREFYGEISTINIKNQSPWIKQNVLVNTIEYGNVPVLNIVNNENDYYVGDKEYIGRCLKEWLLNFDKVELVSDVCHYDMVLFIDLFGTAFDIPANVCPYCYDINQDLMNIYNLSAQDAFNYSREMLIAGHNVIVDGDKHNSM